MARRHLARGLTLALGLTSYVALAQGEGTGAPGLQQAIVISGGISLGAHQAGASYVLMRWAVDHRDDLAGKPLFDTATGASAGNINAFLSAVSWCDARPDAATLADGARKAWLGPTSNLFYSSWVDIGLDKLAPASLDRAAYWKQFRDDAGKLPDGTYKPVYSSQDALLTRSAFENATTDLARAIRTLPVRDDCLVKLGITVTTAEPMELFADAGLSVKTQRFVVPFRAMAGGAPTDRHLVFQNLAWEDDGHADVGRHLELPQDEVGSIPFHTTLEHLVEASSAFPVAFGPVRMPVCLPKGQTPRLTLTAEPRAVKLTCGGTEHEVICPDGTDARCVTFGDGGFFDNVPLGLAGELRKEHGRDAPESTFYRYVNSDLTRPRAAERSQAIAGNGLGFIGSWLGRAVGEARSYELQALARLRGADYGLIPGVGHSRFHVVDRFGPIIGSNLSSFAAFTHREFRRYDYFTGLYDALVSLAFEETGLPQTRPLTPAERHRLDERFSALARRALRPVPGVDPELEAEWLVARLFDWEFGAKAEFPALTEGETARVKHRPIAMIHETLRTIEDDRKRVRVVGSARQRLDYDGRYDGLTGFWGMLAFLEKRVQVEIDDCVDERQACNAESLQALKDFHDSGALPLRDIDAWTTRTANSLLGRFMRVEGEDRAPLADTMEPEVLAANVSRADQAAIERKSGDDVTLKSPCLSRSADLCWKDVVPFSLVWGDAGSGSRGSFGIGWQTTLHPMHLSGTRPRDAAGLVLPLRFEHYFASHAVSSSLTDRVSLGVGWAQRLDPVGASLDLGVNLRNIGGRQIDFGYGATGQWGPFFVAMDAVTPGQPFALGGTTELRATAGLRGMNLPFGFLFRGEEVSPLERTWQAQGVASLVALGGGFFVERPERNVDVLGWRRASAKVRLLEGASAAAFVLPTVVPSAISADVISQSALFDWRLVRVDALGQRLPRGLFVELLGQWRVFVPYTAPAYRPNEGRPAGQALSASLTLLGFDPPGRIIDDVHIVSPTVTVDFRPGAPWNMVGLEASALLLGGLLKVGVAFPALFYRSQATRPTGWNEAMSISLGLGDVDGLVAWAERYVFVDSVMATGQALTENVP